MSALIYKACEPKRSYLNKYDDSLVPPNDAQFYIEHKWEGIVLSIDNEEVTSRMYDFQHDDYDEFIFNKNLISEDDIELLEEGALFYYFIGYTLKNDKKKKSDIIKFRRRVRSINDIDDILHNE